MLAVVALIDDILIDIINLLSLADILRLRQTCKRFHALSAVRNVWYNVLRREVLDKGLPCPGHAASLFSMDSFVLERQTKMALRLDRRWAALKPDMSNVFSFRLDKEVRQLLIIPGGRMIAFMHSDSLTCWAVGNNTEEVRCVGTWKAPCRDCHVTMDNSSQWKTLLAVGPTTGSEVNTTILSVGVEDSTRAISVLATVPTLGKTIQLRGNLIAFDRRFDDLEHFGVEFIDWTRSSRGSILMAQPSPECGDYVGSEFHADGFVVAWQHVVGLFKMRPIPDVNTFLTYPVLNCGLKDSIEAPIAFTHCRTDDLFRRHHDTVHSETFPPLTIVARPSDRDTGLIHSVLESYFDRDRNIQYRLVRCDRVSSRSKCVALTLGPSGRGIRADEDGSIFRCQPLQVLSTHGLLNSTIDFYPNVRVHHLPYLRDGDFLGFDEATGRIFSIDGAIASVVDFL